MARRKKLKQHFSFEVKTSIIALLLLCLSLILILAGFGRAGPVGAGFYKFFNYLFGWGYYLLPLIFLIIGSTILLAKAEKIIKINFWGALLFVCSGLGIIDLIFKEKGGQLGRIVGLLEIPFGYVSALIIVFCLTIVSFLIIFNIPLKIVLPKGTLWNKIKPKEKKKEFKEVSLKIKKIPETTIEKEKAEAPSKAIKKETKEEKEIVYLEKFQRQYQAPPLSLLRSSKEKPCLGDLKANANIIKRTLENFGIAVEMGEITIGPTVTRYTLKPAQGVKISKITSLNQDLSLALAVSPIRIEAPIPGQPLVGIEVPNKAAAMVHLGTLLAETDFQKTSPLIFPLGRAVNGQIFFTDIDKMPHLLIAGATGSGKSICLHSLIISLLYRNSPSLLKLILIDPKKVELSFYQNLPHLISPIVYDGKTALKILRWAILEMEQRYELLLSKGVRDINGYNAHATEEPIPHLLIIIDELADLMNQHAREFEGMVIRLAQMARATGIHLIVSTQRPSVEVVTGLIKANITCRIALQTASQIDSRTILDFAGAEKLLGRGDMLYISPELSKPKRIQGSYISEQEVKQVNDFIKNHNKKQEKTIPQLEELDQGLEPEAFDQEDDELLEQAQEVVKKAKKASASLLQRRLKIGYARAARLLDIMETKGIIGPLDGAKPREVYISNDEQQ